MRIIFLGVNGWYDTVSTGNTLCTLLETERAYIILDAGFGLANADKFIKDDKPVFLFISHMHLDHVCGLHVLPKFKFNRPLRIFLENKNKRYFKKLMNHPFTANISELPFPVQIKYLKSGKKYEEEFFSFSCLHLQHTDTCLGYRFQIENKIIAYCSDTAVCDNDRALAKDADILIHESAYQSAKKDNWGHTSPEEAAKLAKEANVKKLILTHFGAESYNTKEKIKFAEKKAKKIFSNTVCGVFGKSITV